MATGKVIKRALDALQANAVAGFLWNEDLKGFGVKITPSGAASYVVQYRMGGREAATRRYTIGGHGSPWTSSNDRADAERRPHRAIPQPAANAVPPKRARTWI
jgi:hypothetical protein